MKYQKIHGTNLNASSVVLGCMHLNELSKGEAETLIKTTLDEGINFFDHADRYGWGECEELFADAIGMNGDLREKLIIQTKCGIVKGAEGCTDYFDFSRAHILASVEKSLKRLKTDYVDILLLHRPDTLMEPMEVAEAIDILHSKGMVRYFGVSNQNPTQMELLQKYVNQKFVVNQLQLSMAYTPMIDSGMTVNMLLGQSTVRDGGILEYCRLKDVTIQAWSPFQYGFFEGVFLNEKEKYGELNKEIDIAAKKYGVTNNGIAVAWILRHPAEMQVVLGTTKPKRVKECAAGSEVYIPRDEWYKMYVAAGGIIP